MGGFDQSLLRWVNQDWANPWLDRVMLFITNFAKEPFGVSVLVAGWLALLVWGGSRGRRAALVTLPALIIANELSDLGKAHLGFLRPCVELEGLRLVAGKLTSGGMPSAHAANTAAVVTVLYYFLGPRWWILWLLPLLSGLSRVYLGVHYPSQVAAGWVLGVCIGLALALVFRDRKPVAEQSATGEQAAKKEADSEELSEVS